MDFLMTKITFIWFCNT